MARNIGAKGETRAEVRRLYVVERIRSPREIASRLDISTQQVYVHLDKLREAGELPEEGAA